LLSEVEAPLRVTEIANKESVQFVLLSEVEVHAKLVSNRGGPSTTLRVTLIAKKEKVLFVLLSEVEAPAQGDMVERFMIVKRGNYETILCVYT
jgi:hypothetical protein